jgi:ligand-binding SRPBCC domain-containing protein
MSSPQVFSRSVDIDAPVGEVFRFHLDTRNAPHISPDGARFLAVEGSFPVSVGSRVTLRVKQPPAPFAQTWVVRIDEIVPDALVVDVAERSPFAEWRHEHRFAPLPDGGTRMTDHITYRLPLGPLGRLADRLVGRRVLVRMFEERHRKTRALFEGGGPAE